MAFTDSEDVYSDPSGWTTEDAYMCMRWLTRVIAKAPSKPFYRGVLAGLDFGRMADEPRAIARAALRDVPEARGLLSRAQAAAIGATRPLDPPLRLSDHPMEDGPWAWMGVLL